MCVPPETRNRTPPVKHRTGVYVRTPVRCVIRHAISVARPPCPPSPNTKQCKLITRNRYIRTCTCTLRYQERAELREATKSLPSALPPVKHTTIQTNSACLRVQTPALLNPIQTVYQPYASCTYVCTYIHTPGHLISILLALRVRYLFKDVTGYIDVRYSFHADMNVVCSDQSQPSNLTASVTSIFHVEAKTQKPEAFQEIKSSKLAKTLVLVYET